MKATPQPTEDRFLGRVLQDRFRVVERIAAGGMGVVYKAEQVSLGGRPVALKILESRHNELTDAHFSERFFLEAAVVAKLTHPNTIILHDYGRTDDDVYYFAMEYVDGLTLTKRMRTQGPLDPATALHVALQICGSLREAHEAGIVHRDMKPGNIMLTHRGGDEAFVKVLDFGLVKVMGQDVGMEITKSGMLMGSPRYMAPEQVTGKPIDHLADIYSLGCVMYHMVCGAPPCRQESQYDVLRAQVEQPPAPLREVWASCPVSERFEAVIRQCLEKDKTKRPESMNALAQALTACAEEIGTGGWAIASACRPLPLSQEEIDRIVQQGSGDSGSGDSGSGDFGSGNLGSGDSSSVSLSSPSASWPSISLSGGSVPSVPLAATPPQSPVTKFEPSPTSSPARVPSWALFGGVLALFTIVGVALAMVIPATPPEPEAPSASAGDLPVQVSTSEPVRLVTDPAGARVRRGDEDLGDSPLTVRVTPGEPQTLTVSAPGYAPRTVSVHAGRETLRVSLTPTPAEPPAPTTAEPEVPAEPEDDPSPTARGRRRARSSTARPDRTADQPSANASGQPDQGDEPPNEPASPTPSVDEAPPSAGESNEWGGRGAGSDNRDPWAR